MQNSVVFQIDLRLRKIRVAFEVRTPCQQARLPPPRCDKPSQDSQSPHLQTSWETGTSEKTLSPWGTRPITHKSERPPQVVHTPLTHGIRAKPTHIVDADERLTRNHRVTIRRHRVAPTRLHQAFGELTPGNRSCQLLQAQQRRNDKDPLIESEQPAGRYRMRPNMR